MARALLALIGILVTSNVAMADIAGMVLKVEGSRLVVNRGYTDGFEIGTLYDLERQDLPMLDVRDTL